MGKTINFILEINKEEIYRKNFKILFIILCVLFFLDSWVTTPLGLMNGAYEKNFIANYFYQIFGISFFFFSPLFSIGVCFGACKLFENILEVVSKNKKKRERVLAKKIKYLPVYFFLMGFIIMMAYTVGNNINILLDIFGGVRW